MNRPFVSPFAYLVKRRARVERRGATRLFPPQYTVCQLRRGGEPPANAVVHNLSVLGVGLVTDREYPPGSALQLLLVNASYTFAVALEMKVVRCFAVGGRWFLGGPFARPLGHDELVPFLL
jgi:hypothetical protein